MSQQLEYYIDRLAEGKITSQEWGELKLLLQQPGNADELQKVLDNQLFALNDNAIDYPDVVARVQAAVEQSIKKEKRLTSPEKTPAFPDRKPVLRLQSWRAAAAVVLLVGLVAFFLIRTVDKPSGGMSQSLPETEITPGREGAVLILADGTDILLDTISDGSVVALQGGATARVINGKLVYEGYASAAVFNTMKTPKGRQFQVSLPDGSQVWLNSASSITYPVSFSGAERRVKLTGEAYFEVEKAEAPFIVNADDRAEIAVLGTHFNINTYQDEASLTTTLLEGRVRVSVSDAKEVILNPGQQAQVSGSGTNLDINVSDSANLEKVMAWKAGLFNFDGAELGDVMRELSRWYDIEVVYENNIPSTRFFGKMARDLPLTGVLLALEKSNVRFRVEGRKIIVMSEKNENS